MTGTRGSWIGVLATALLLLSCGEEVGSEVLPDDLYLPEQDRSLRTITVEADRITLVYDIDAHDVGLVEGLLVAGEAQGGYLREIETVSISDSRAMVRTRDVALTDAIAVGTLHEALVPAGVWQLDPDGEQATMAPGGGVDLAGTLLFEGYSSEADLRVEILEGSLAFDPAVQLDLAIEDGRLQQLAVVVSGPLALDLAAQVSLDLKYSYTTEVPLASLRQPFTSSLGGVPVAGEIAIDLRGGFELVAQSGGEVSEHVRIASHVRAGAAYDGSDWTGIWSVEPETTVVEDPGWEFDDATALRVWIVPEVHLSLYGADGPRVEVQPFVDAVLTDVGPPQWTLASGLAGQVEVPTGRFDPAVDGFTQTMPAEGTVVAENDDSWTGWSQVAAGEGFSCALTTDGSLGCWGNDDQGQASPPVGSFVSVTAGRSHACALDADGAVTCWGRDDEGQSTPPAAAFAQVEAGSDFTCGVKTSGVARCWGRDMDGQATPPGIPFAQVDAGTWHGCGVSTFGDAICWGNDADGQASPPGGSFDHVSGWRRHSCGVRSGGDLACWGCAQFDMGECDPPPGPYLQVDVGGNHSCALNGQERVTCWGANVAGQAEVPLGSYTRVSAGDDHTCAVTTGGQLTCWGGDEFGQATPPEVAP